MSKFKSHCTRAVSTSFLASHNISIKEMGFGPDFLQWIRTFYRNLTSCVLNNGFTTGIFFLKRGVRQGDPLSPLLFILALETLVCQIQENKNIVSAIVLRRTITSAYISCEYNRFTSLFAACIRRHSGDSNNFCTFPLHKIN